MNIPGSVSNAFGFTFGPAKLIKIIAIIVNKNDNPIQMWKGISKAPFPLGYAVYKSVSGPNKAGAYSLNKTDNKNPKITPTIAAVPATVVVKKGTLTATFTVTTKKPAAQTAVTLSAVTGGAAKTGTLTVKP